MVDAARFAGDVRSVERLISDIERIDEIERIDQALWLTGAYTLAFAHRIMEFLPEVWALWAAPGLARQDSRP